MYVAITRAEISTLPAPNSKDPVFGTERERAQRAIDEFQKVAAKYGEPYRTEARYFIATNMLYIDREKAVNELAEVSKLSVVEPATLAKWNQGIPINTILAQITKRGFAGELG